MQPWTVSGLRRSALSWHFHQTRMGYHALAGQSHPRSASLSMQRPLQYELWWVICPVRVDCIPCVNPPIQIKVWFIRKPHAVNKCLVICISLQEPLAHLQSRPIVRPAKTLLLEFEKVWDGDLWWEYDAMTSLLSQSSVNVDAPRALGSPGQRYAWRQCSELCHKHIFRKLGIPIQSSVASNWLRFFQWNLNI